MSRIRHHLTYANVMSTLAVFLVLGGGTALASYVISSNSQVAPGTISGHHAPTGKHANIIGGSLNGQDVNNESLTGADVENGGVKKQDLGVPATFISAGLPSTPCQLPENTWRDATGIGYNGPVGYYRDPFGIVHLQGAIVRCGDRSGSGGPSDDYVFTLPPGYRPPDNVYTLGVIPATGVAHEVLIDHFGRLGVDAVTAGYSFSLEGISFRCAPAGQNGCP